MDVVFIPAQPHMVGGRARAVAVVRIHGMKRPPARPPLRPHPACLPAHCTHRDDGGLAVVGTAAMQGRKKPVAIHFFAPGAGIESSKRRREDVASVFSGISISKFKRSVNSENPFCIQECAIEAPHCDFLTLCVAGDGTRCRAQMQIAPKGGFKRGS